MRTAVSFSAIMTLAHALFLYRKDSCSSWSLKVSSPFSDKTLALVDFLLLRNVIHGLCGNTVVAVIPSFNEALNVLDVSKLRLTARAPVILTGQMIQAAAKNVLAHLKWKHCPSGIHHHIRCERCPCMKRLPSTRESYVIYTSLIGQIMECRKIPRTSLVSINVN